MRRYVTVRRTCSPQKRFFPWRMGTPSNTWFTWPT